ncbi:MAG: phage head morphogenesis protein, partial [Cyanobacteria bacterium REEB65]|nr:phage head morphogenesis protein [Cyanobacteria bacterium REEB65]
MRGNALATVLAAIAAGRAMLRLRSGTDDHDHDMPEENTYSLPDGDDIADELKAQFAAIAKDVLGTLPGIGEPLPTSIANLGHYAEGMSEAMTPLISAYWDESGKQTMARLGLDAAENWKVTNPHLKSEIRKQALSFCQSTLATTSKSIHDALGKLRDELTTGLVDEGESIRQLRKRVEGVFEGMDRWKARQIAATEASRAVHAAQLTAGQESGVVAGLELLVSANSCPLCKKIATEVKQVPLGQPFATIGHSEHYASIKHPPIHPGCRCTAIEVLMPEYGGPEHPHWGGPLDQPQKSLKGDYEPPDGKKVAEPQPERLDKPLVKPKSRPVGEALRVDFKGALAAKAESTIETIDAVHGDGALPAIPVRDKVRVRSHDSEFLSK